MEDLELRPLRIAAKKALAGDIFLFELTAPGGGDLPPFEAGAHVTVETPSGKRYGNLCIGCDRFHEQVLGPVIAELRQRRLAQRAAA